MSSPQCIYRYQSPEYIAKMKRKRTSSKKPYIELVMRLDTARKLDKMLKGSKQSGKWKFKK